MIVEIELLATLSVEANWICSSMILRGFFLNLAGFLKAIIELAECMGAGAWLHGHMVAWLHRFMGACFHS